MERSEGPPTPSSQPRTEAIRAAEYVRMSTEHQQYSTENQREVIRQYAERRGMTIVRTYTDAGKSGPAAKNWRHISPTRLRVCVGSRNGFCMTVAIPSQCELENTIVPPLARPQQALLWFRDHMLGRAHVSFSKGVLTCVLKSMS